MIRSGQWIREHGPDSGRLNGIPLARPHASHFFAGGPVNERHHVREVK
jgi:hypothetical protein